MIENRLYGITCNSMNMFCLLKFTLVFQFLKELKSSFNYQNIFTLNYGTKNFHSVKKKKPLPILAPAIASHIFQAWHNMNFMLII
jgi:hypothetical protein